MDLPSAHRRPKFRLEEIEKKDAAKLSLGFFVSFLILIVVWQLIKKPMHNPESNTTIVAECEDPAQRQAVALGESGLPFDTAISVECVRATASFSADKDALPVQFRIKLEAKADELTNMDTVFKQFKAYDITVSGSSPTVVETDISCVDENCRMSSDLAYIIDKDVASITDVDFKLEKNSSNPFLKKAMETISVVTVSTNPDFLFNELLMRYFFLVIATLVSAMFYHQIAFGRLKYPWHAWALEQKWTFILLVLLLGFNNPFCFLKVRSDGVNLGLWLFVDDALRYTFLLGYLLAVLSMTDHMSQTKRKTTKEFYVPKLTLLVPLWLVLVVRSQMSNRPENTMDNPSVLAFVSVFIAVYIIWLFYLIAIMIHKVSSTTTGPQVHVGSRFKFVWGLNVIMIAAIGAALYRVNNWGVEATEFIFGIVGFNFYVFILAALFAPAMTSMPYRAPVQPNPDAEVIINDEYEVEGDY